MENNGAGPSTPTPNHIGVSNGSPAVPTHHAGWGLSLDQNEDHNMTFGNSMIPDLGSDALLRMSNEEFLNMFPQPSDSTGPGEASAISFGDLLQAPIPPPSFLEMPQEFRQHQAMGQIPNQPPGEPPTHSNIPSVYVQGRTGLTFPAASGSQPFTDISEMEKLAKDMIGTMGRLRFQCTVSLHLLRKQHNASYKFYVKLREQQPEHVADVTWNRYVDEMALTYNLLRDYQMQAYKTFCAAMKIWIRYHRTFFSQTTIDRWNIELAGYRDIQQSILAYKFPDWPNQQGLPPFKDVVETFMNLPDDTPTSKA